MGSKYSYAVFFEALFRNGCLFFETRVKAGRNTRRSDRDLNSNNFKIEDGLMYSNPEMMSPVPLAVHRRFPLPARKM